MVKKSQICWVLKLQGIASFVFGQPHYANFPMLADSFQNSYVSGHQEHQIRLHGRFHQNPKSWPLKSMPFMDDDPSCVYIGIKFFPKYTTRLKMLSSKPYQSHDIHGMIKSFPMEVRIILYHWAHGVAVPVCPVGVRLGNESNWGTESIMNRSSARGG